jgi:hypothetical protein
LMSKHWWGIVTGKDATDARAIVSKFKTRANFNTIVAEGKFEPLSNGPMASNSLWRRD